MHFALDRRVVLIEHLHAFAAEFGGIAFLQEDHLAGGGHDRRHVGGNEVLAIAAPCIAEVMGKEVTGLRIVSIKKVG